MSHTTLPESWVLARIGDLCLPVRDVNFRNRESNSFRYIDISSIDREQKAIGHVDEIDKVEAPSRARQIVLKDDVLVSTVRPGLNAVALVPESLNNEICSTGFCVLRANSNILDASYLFAWVRSSTFIQNLTHAERGIGYPAVSNRDVENTQIPLPPLPEQRRIAAILSEADEIRKLRQQANEKTQKIVEALFYDTFGDPAINPKQWKSVVLGDLIYSAQDGPHVSPTYSQEGIPFLSTRNIRAGQIIWDDLKYISIDEAKIHWKKCKPEIGDVLYTKGGITGLAKTVDFDREFAIWVHIALLKVKHGLVDPLWLENMLNMNYCYLQSQNLTHGIANRDLGLTRMIGIKMYLPPLDLQKHYVVQIASVKDAENQQIIASQRLQNLYQSLLAQAFSGELTASWRKSLSTELWRESHRAELEQAAEARNRLLKGWDRATNVPPPQQLHESQVTNRPELTKGLTILQTALLALIEEQDDTYFTATKVHGDILPHVDEQGIYQEELDREGRYTLFVDLDCSLDTIRRELHFLARMGLVKELTLPVEEESGVGIVHFITAYRSLRLEDDCQQYDIAS